MAGYRSCSGNPRRNTDSYFDAGGQHVLEQKHAVLVDWKRY